MSIKIRKPGNKATIVIRRSPATMTNSCTDQVHYTAKAFGSKGLFSSGSPEMNFLHALLRLLQLTLTVWLLSSMTFLFVDSLQHHLMIKLHQFHSLPGQRMSVAVNKIQI